MNSKLREEGVDFLFRSILQLKTVDECYDFFEDLCTVQIGRASCRERV